VLLSIISSFFGFLTSNNNLFTVGVGLLCLNSFLLPNLFGSLQQFIQILEHFLVVHVEILERDNFYDWLLEWLTDNRHLFIVSTNYRAKVMKNNTNQDHLYSWLLYNRKTVDADMVSLRNPPPVLFEPGPGKHLLWYKGRLIFLDRCSEKGDNSSSYDSAQTNQHASKIILWKLGPSKEVFHLMLTEARDYCLSKNKGKLVVFTRDNNFTRLASWQVFTRQEKIPFHSVILDGAQAQEILNDVKLFLGRKSDYLAKSVPYRRSYLFYGPPGGGKTSFVKALAGQLNFNVCIVSLSSEIDNEVLNGLFVNAPENTILLIEDIDSIFPSREEEEQSTNSKNLSVENMSHGHKKGLTLAGLLNAIDGIASQEGRIIIMTTNYPEKLDPALLRPGRLDRAYEFGLATKDQARRFFLKFHPKHIDLANKFVANFQEKRFSMAQLQSYFIFTMDDPKAAADYHRFVQFTKQQEIGRTKPTQKENVNDNK